MIQFSDDKGINAREEVEIACDRTGEEGDTWNWQRGPGFTLRYIPVIGHLLSGGLAVVCTHWRIPTVRRESQSSVMRRIDMFPEADNII